MTDARVRRGRKSEHVATRYLLPLFPEARTVGTSLPGRDILGTSADDVRWIHGDPDLDLPDVRGVAPEVKARSRFEPLKAMAQAKRNAQGDIPMVILRMDGQGETQVDDWLAIFTFEDARELIGRAFNLGKYARAAEQSSSEERREGFASSPGAGLGSNSDHSGNEVLEGLLSTFLHDLGILDRSKEIQIHGSKSQSGQGSQ